MILRPCLVLIIISLLLPFSALAVDTKVYRGDQSLFEDTVWDGEILIDGILTVAADTTLEIRPGSRIRFTRFDSNGDGIGEHEIFSQGTIKVLGTEAEPVLFTSAESNPRPGDWGAINMMVSEEENLLEFCNVEYGYRGFKNVRGAQFQESQVVIENCRFQDNLNGVQFRDSVVTLRNSVISGSHWGLRCVYSELEMTSCLIENNLVNGANIRDGKLNISGNRIVGNRRGLYLQRSKGQVVGNDLSANSEHGIFLEDSDVEVADNRLVENGRAGVRWLNSEGRLARNHISDNGVYALINDGSTAVAARNNWWGSADKKVIAAAVRDGSDRPGVGMVDSRYPLIMPLTQSRKVQ
jgi:parallel beta-helix repeat protein